MGAQTFVKEDKLQGREFMVVFWSVPQSLDTNLMTYMNSRRIWYEKCWNLTFIFKFESLERESKFLTHLSGTYRAKPMKAERIISENV